MNKQRLKRQLKRQLKKLKTPLIVLGAIVAVCVVMLLLGRVGGTMSGETATSLQDNVRRYAVQCYAIEGFFPEDIAYLSDHYGLYINEDDYIYHYRYQGSNLMPEIYVLVK